MAPAEEPVITVVWGVGTGPTGTSSYDAALAAAGVADYNLRHVSSIIPPGVPVEAAGTATDLGPVGGALTAVEARCTRAGPGRVTAGLGWSRDPDGPGVFYEAAGESDEAAVERRIVEGLKAGRGLRDWAFEPGEAVRVTTGRVPDGTFGTAVALAAYGRAQPIV